MFSKDLFRELSVQASVAEFTDATDDIMARVNDVVKKAASHEYDMGAISPIGENGKPRMLKITAWIAFADRPNKNGDAFRAADLQRVVEGGMFQAPFFGMIDYNHDFQPYGVWYNAEYLQHPTNGLSGIMAEGALFSWRFSDLTNKLLGIQERQGHIDVSMAVIPKSVELDNDIQYGSRAILIEPVFFTTSVLTVDPAEPDANGLGTEDVAESTEDRKNRLLAIASLGTEEDVKMDEKLLKAIEEIISNAAAENSETLSKLVEEVKRIPELESSLNTASEGLEAAKTELEALQGTHETVKAQLEAVNSELATANEELETLRAFKASIEEKEEAEKLNALREARLAALPESYKKVLGDKEEADREKVETALVNMDELQWETFLASFPKKESLVDKSKKEGILSGVTDDRNNELAIFNL